MANTVIDLDQMTEAQKRKLYASLSHEYGNPASKTVQDISPDEEMVWEVINDVVGYRRHLGEVLVKCGKDYSRADFRDAVAYVMGFINRGSRIRLNRTQRMALVSCGVAKVSSRMYNRGVPISHRVLVQQLATVPDALDRAFPGYADSHVLDRAVAMV